jgi:voltage-gated potassium channel
MKKQIDKSKSFRDRLYEIIFEADTKAGKWFDIVLLLLIVISIIVVMLQSVASYHDKYETLFNALEWIITIIFSIEYLARIYVTNKPKTYIFSFFGIIDFLSTIPKYLAMFSIGSTALVAFRALRLLRIFRVLKLSPFIGEAEGLSKALQRSKAKISVFLLAVLSLTIILGTIMYLIEVNENSGFDNIPKSMYWAIVTLTTVGYGDIAPVTPFGQFLASIIMILGYGILAVPTGIVSAEYSRQKQVHTSTQSCPNCNASDHHDDAQFCYDCGAKMN